MAAILVGGMKCRTGFWKGTTKGSFQQSLVEIGSVVSEEKIFFLISSPLFSIFSLVAILVVSRDHRTQIWKGVIQGSFHKSLVEIGSVVSEEKILLKFHPPFFLFLAWWPSWLEVGITGHIFGREPSNDYFIKMLFLLSKWFQKRRFLWEFPIGSYVKLSSAVAAILVGVLKSAKVQSS